MNWQQSSCNCTSVAPCQPMNSNPLTFLFLVSLFGITTFILCCLVSQFCKALSVTVDLLTDCGCDVAGAKWLLQQPSAGAYYAAKYPEMVNIASAQLCQPSQQVPIRVKRIGDDRQMFYFILFLFLFLLFIIIIIFLIILFIYFFASCYESQLCFSLYCR
jgi:hypothetical protein